MTWIVFQEHGTCHIEQGKAEEEGKTIVPASFNIFSVNSLPLTLHVRESCQYGTKTISL